MFKLVGPYRNGIPIAGISYELARSNAIAMIKGLKRRVELIRDPGNEHDPNAIKVIGHWESKRGKPLSGQIGWVPKDEAKEIARSYPDGPIGAKLKVIDRPSSGKSPGIRIDIGRPSKRAKKRAEGVELNIL